MSIHFWCRSFISMSFHAQKLFQCNFKLFIFRSFHLWCRSFIPMSFQYFPAKKLFHVISSLVHKQRQNSTESEESIRISPSGSITSHKGGGEEKQPPQHDIATPTERVCELQQLRDYLFQYHFNISVHKNYSHVIFLFISFSHFCTPFVLVITPVDNVS